MEELLNITALQEQAGQLYIWLQGMMNWHALAQLVTVIALSAFGWSVAKRAAHALSASHLPWVERTRKIVAAHYYISPRQIMFLICAPVLLWLALLVTTAAAWPDAGIRVAAVLATAWAAIRLSSGLIRSTFWATSFALVVWVLAALHVLGWLAPAANVLDSAAISFGERRLSFLLLIKGSIVFAILLWFAGLLGRSLERVLENTQDFTPSQKVLFAKIGRIVLVALAVMVGLNTFGIDFTALAVFSGALGIGIGFGLQKVFSNLVSGFILLLDKSIKPGDVIGVGDTFGWVNRIGARQVSILTRDGKEHLIPNEMLITEQVENWSYSDNNVRVRIPIGVSYKSDIHKVREILLEIINNNPRILPRPQPTCLVTGFGDSSVDFELRVWIQDPVNGIGNVKSSIYLAAWDAFKQNGIEIPFPQRDIHLDTDTLRDLIAQTGKGAQTKA
ncbi:MAG: mechanosensitive ion channel [Alphaproteobacteria bacterium]|nr:mechanosensitive ion channel [Alphaproteobacteria bacterium]